MADLPDYPITRNEQYLAAIAGEETELPDFPITREEKYLDYIAKNRSGGLPEITDADDGKVLTAESGEWVAKESSSGGGFGCIVIGIDDEDKTGFHYIVGSYADALHGAFCVLVADYHNEGGTDDYVMAKYRNTDGQYHVIYRFEDDQEDGLYGVYELELHADGTIEEWGRPS